MEPDDNPELDDLDDFVDVVADDQLRLMFLCCHPALNDDAQVALTLRLLGGLDGPEIARAFLVHPIVVGNGQRLFEDTPTHRLQLVSQGTFSTGVLNLAYVPADA